MAYEVERRFSKRRKISPRLTQISLQMTPKAALLQESLHPHKRTHEPAKTRLYALKNSNRYRAR
jgi:hypothetical protein